MTTSWEELRKQLVRPEDEPEIARLRAEMENQVLAHRLAEARWPPGRAAAAGMRAPS